ncbi:ATP-grasp domain-containing protein [Salegentibacter sp. HM20]
MKNILVTGAGALLGQGILRCLNFSSNNYNIISADPDVRSTGHALAHASYKIPYITSGDYLEKIEEIILKERIDIILIGTDVELPVFAENKEYLEKEYNVKVVVSNSKVIAISNDKYLTSKFLKENGFPFPLSALTTNANDINFLKNNADFPLIAKPVDGARSKGIEIIHNEAELDTLCAYKNNLVVQEKIGEDEGEFTTGCVVVDGKCVSVVSLTRDLRDGNTWRAYRKGNTAYDSKISKIAETLGVEGPANFQYRIRNGEPVIFEVNCRFSGTTPIRLMYGFNEVEALVEYYLEDIPIAWPVLKEGTVLRTFSDVFVPNDNIEQFDRDGYTSNYNSQYYPFKLK